MHIRADSCRIRRFRASERAAALSTFHRACGLTAGTIDRRATRSRTPWNRTTSSPAGRNGFAAPPTRARRCASAAAARRTCTGRRCDGEILDTRAASAASSPTTRPSSSSPCRRGTPLARGRSGAARMRPDAAVRAAAFRARRPSAAASRRASRVRAAAWTGAPRDFVLGAVVMDGRGEVLHFGGQVVKNVAGYDVVAASGRLARHARPDPRTVDQGAAEARRRSDAQVRHARDRRRAQAQRMGRPSVADHRQRVARRHARAAARGRGRGREGGAHVARRRGGGRRRGRSLLGRPARADAIRSSR